MKRKTITMVIAISNYCPIFGQTIEIRKEKHVLWSEVDDITTQQDQPFYHPTPKPFLLKRIGNTLSRMRSTKKIIKQHKTDKCLERIKLRGNELCCVL